MVVKRKKIPVKPVPSDTIFQPFKDFAKLESSGGLLLILATIIALFLANSPLGESMHHWLEIPLSIGVGHNQLTLSLHHWINDGLMSIFFLVVGLEIKREIMVGELSSLRQAALPVAAALGGMLVPALIYLVFNQEAPGRDGWGISMATDIAFALGILALLGNRVPLSLKIFLTALAIIDDLGAVLVIALFYTSEVSWQMLGIALVILVLLICANRIGLRHPMVYLGLGALLWVVTLKSGLHATIAGVILAATVPARARINGRNYLDTSRQLLQELETLKIAEKRKFMNDEQLAVIHTVHILNAHVETPLQRMEHALHSWTTYLIVPLFALANAGVNLSLEHSGGYGFVAIGVFLGLVVGKMLGIFGFSWMAVKLGFGSLPPGVNWRHIFGASWLGGIGFTMSLFITNLAFSSPELVQMAKLGVLAGSIVAGVVGYLVLFKTVNEQTE